MSECIIHAPHRLQVLLAILFNSMVIHGTAAEGLLEGSMTLIPKSQSITRLSDKYRAITLSSLIGKIFDLIILRKQKQSLMSDDLQFGFKEQSSTALCTNMLLETANHFVSKGSKVYVVFLDASKAFDRVCYTKLFRILERIGMNRFYIRCLIYMYLNQKLCVTWNGIKSEKFTVSNGVRQGGVLSPLLFSMYVDGLFMRLCHSGYGCRIGPHFVGADGYADDICILSLTPYGLRTMVSMCEAYANEYCIEFNGSKCEMLIFSRQPLPENVYPRVLVNSAAVPVKQSVIHLSHKISCDVSERPMDNIIANSYKQYNLFLSRFGKIALTYCCSFYGASLYDLKDIESVLVALRKCTRHIWNISPRTHSDILPHMTGICRHMLTKRFAKYYNNALGSKNDIVKYVFTAAAYTPGSVTSNNIKMLCDAADHNFLNSLEFVVKCDCLGDEELGRKAAFIQELCMVRDGQLFDIGDIIDHLCFSCTISTNKDDDDIYK